MVNEKSKSTQSTGKTSSVGYQTEQGTDTAKLVDLLSNVLRSVQDQVKAQPKLTLEGEAQLAVDEYMKISEELMVPLSRKQVINKPKWKSPPISPRAEVQVEK